MAISRLGIIGCGNMGEAILKGVTDSEFLDKKDIIFFEESPKREKYIMAKYNITSSVSNKVLAETSENILIAVKPQNIKKVLNEIKEGLDCDGYHSIISIVAGISTHYIEIILDKKVPVIRVMPNMPALYQKGMSAISPGKYVKEKDIFFVEKLIKSIGDYVTIDEKFQNIATALNGSGPAYFFLFCKHLIKAGVEEGLSWETAEKLVVNTMIGAGETIKNSKTDINELIKSVTSPGGTTERALGVFRDKKINEIIFEAVGEAIGRAEELESFLK